MGVQLAKAFVTVRADSTQLGRDLDKTKRKTSVAMNSIASSAKLAMAGIAVAGAAAFAKIAVIVRESTSAFERQIRAQVRIAAQIKATGNAANLTAKDLQIFAAELQKTMNVADEEVLEAMSTLLTFKNVTGETFKEATKLAIDLGEVMGKGDIKSGFLQLGRVLEDPVRNISALTKSGVSFSKQQLEMIKNLAETNRLVEAQTMVLDTLSEQGIGGVSEALRNTEIGQLKALRLELDDMSEVLGKEMVPAQKEWLETQKELKPLLAEMAKIVKELTDAMTEAVGEGGGGLSAFVAEIKKAVPVLKFTTKVGFTPLLGLVRLLTGAYETLATAVEAATDRLRLFGLVGAKQEDVIVPGLGLKAGEKELKRQERLEAIQKKKAARLRVLLGPGPDPTIGPTIQRSPLQQGLGGQVGPGIPGLLMGIGTAISTAMASQPVLDAIRGDLIQPGRSGFLEFGQRIQDAFLQKDEDSLDKNRNSLLVQALQKQDELIAAIKGQEAGGLI